MLIHHATRMAPILALSGFMAVGCSKETAGGSRDAAVGTGGVSIGLDAAGGSNADAAGRSGVDAAGGTNADARALVDSRDAASLDGSGGGSDTRANGGGDGKPDVAAGDSNKTVTDASVASDLGPDLAAGGRGGNPGTGGSLGTGGAGPVFDGGSGSSGTPYGKPGPSCPGSAPICGAAKDEDCCTRLLVPGGSFNRSNDANYPATVSDFGLDRFEVTVGRFRVFLNAGQGTRANPPAAGAGAHPVAPGTGWSSDWNVNLAADTASLTGALLQSNLHTWTDAPGANESQPINRVTWFEAFAFCAWDGGRLPTEAEWNYAAAGGSEQRKYPWGNSEPDASRASYGCMVGSCPHIIAVGSRPAGDGRWGHSDLAGNVQEWTFDWIPTTLYPMPCNDCANTTVGVYRVQRGGNYYFEASLITTSYRDYDEPAARDVLYGFRCARTGQ